MQIDEMKQRLIEARAELTEARTSARREKADAHVEGREPNKAVMNKPSELEAEIEQLPDEIYKAEIKQKQNLKTTGEKMAAEFEPLVQPALDEWREAQAEQEAAEKRVRETRAELDRVKSRAENGRGKVNQADRELETLYERGPIDGYAASV